MKGARLVGVIHLPPLPGSPRFCGEGGTWEAILRRVQSEAAMFRAHGFDLAVVENFGDTPFFATRVPAVTVAAMTSCALAAQAVAPDLPLGINVLRNDPDAALSIAAVVRAACIRVNVHVGARVTDQGIVEGRAAETLRQRKALAPDVQVWADVDVKHSSPLARQTADALEQEVKDAVLRGMADALLVTGEGTGAVPPLEKLRRVRHALDGANALQASDAASLAPVPLHVASGATVESLAELATVADGVIVGSALRCDGRAGAPLDPARLARFADAFHQPGAFGRKIPAKTG